MGLIKDAMTGGINYSNPAGFHSTAINQLAQDMAQFPNDPYALTTLCEWLANGGYEKDLEFCANSMNYWREVVKETSEDRAKHPIRSWIRDTWWTICQLRSNK